MSFCSKNNLTGLVNSINEPVNKGFKRLSLVLLMVLPFHQAWSSSENSQSRFLKTQTSTKAGESAQRIISLAPHITEMLFSAGAGDKIVGVVAYSDFPKEALKLPIIGSYNAINIEEIIQLNPDLILGWQSANRLQDIQRLKELGLKVLQSDVYTLDDIPNEIERLGQLAGTQIQATKSAKTLRQTLAEVRQRYQHAQPISSFYEIWNQPIITMNGKQFISQALEACAAKNVYYELTTLSAEVSLESLFERNPQLFLLGGEQVFQNGWLKFWQQYPNLQAVKQQQIYLLDNNLYQRPTARLINALPELCKHVDMAREHYQRLENK